MRSHSSTTRPASLLAALVLAGGLTACSSVQDAATGAASDAASSAATKVSQAAADEVRQRVCSRVQDGQISAQDRQVLGGLVQAAKAAGLPAEVTGPLGEVSGSDQPPAQAVDALREACAAS